MVGPVSQALLQPPPPHFTSWIKVWYLPFSQDPAEGAWEHLARVQQLLEDKEQAVAILQETVQVRPAGHSCPDILSCRTGKQRALLPSLLATSVQSPAEFLPCWFCPRAGLSRGWSRQNLGRKSPHLLSLFRKQCMEYSSHTQKQRKEHGPPYH